MFKPNTRRGAAVILVVLIHLGAFEWWRTKLNAEPGPSPKTTTITLRYWEPFDPKNDLCGPKTVVGNPCWVETKDGWGMFGAFYPHDWAMRVEGAVEPGN